jgi:hypothetical protein
MSDSGPKVSIEGISRPTFLSIGPRRSMSDPDHGRIDDTVLSRGRILETFFSMGLANVEIPSIVSKNVVESSGDAVPTEIGQFLISRSGSSTQFSPEWFRGQQTIHTDGVPRAGISQDGPIGGIVHPLQALGRKILQVDSVGVVAMAVAVAPVLVLSW